MIDTIFLIVGFIILNLYMVIAGKSPTDAFLIGTAGGGLGYVFGILLTRAVDDGLEE